MEKRLGGSWAVIREGRSAEAFKAIELFPGPESHYRWYFQILNKERCRMNSTKCSIEMFKTDFGNKTRFGHTPAPAGRSKKFRPLEPHSDTCPFLPVRAVLLSEPLAHQNTSSLKQFFDRAFGGRWTVLVCFPPLKCCRNGRRSWRTGRPTSRSQCIT